MTKWSHFWYLTLDFFSSPLYLRNQWLKLLIANSTEEQFSNSEMVTKSSFYKKLKQSNCSFGYKVLVPPPKHVKTEYGKFQLLVNHATNVHICKAYWLFMLYPMLNNIMIMMPPVALEIGHNIGLHAIKRIIMTFDAVASFVLNETGMIFTCSFIFVKFTWRKQTNQYLMFGLAFPFSIVASIGFVYGSINSGKKPQWTLLADIYFHYFLRWWVIRIFMLSWTKYGPLFFVNENVSHHIVARTNGHKVNAHTHTLHIHPRIFLYTVANYNCLAHANVKQLNQFTSIARLILYHSYSYPHTHTHTHKMHDHIQINFIAHRNQ